MDDDKSVVDVEPKSDGRLSPPWREAVRRVVEATPEPGTIFRHSWMFVVMGLPEITGDMPHGDAEKIRQRYRQQVHMMRITLLNDHKIDLVSREGVGYEVVAPGDQAPTAMADFRTAIRSAFDKVAMRVDNVAEHRLTSDETKALDDARARVSRYRQMTAKALPMLEREPKE